MANQQDPSIQENDPYASPKKTVLVLSSTEGIEVARALQIGIQEASNHLIEATVWDRTMPKGWILDHVVTTIERFPFVVVALTPDDESTSRGHAARTPRDNLVMELGLAIATNGVDRTFLVQSADCALKLPSDIHGLLHYSYRNRSDRDTVDAVREAASAIAQRIAEEDAEMSWPMFFSQIEQMSKDVQRSRHDLKRPGLRPHIVVGVNMGGFVAGGLLFYLNRCRWHFLTLWTKHESPYRMLPERQEDFVTELRDVAQRVRTVDREAPRILLVDDSDKSGESMDKAVALVRETVPDAEIKRAVIVYLGPPNKQPEFTCQIGYGRFKYAPV